MTTIYKFVCGYTKAGIATSPSSAPTITIVDSGNNILASAQATTARTNIAGVYDYSYSGADSLDLIGLYHTSDITVDRQDLHSHPYNAVILKAIETAGTVVDAIKVKTDNLPTDPADQSLLEAAIAAIPSAPTVNQIDAQLSGTHGAGTWGGGSGSGSISWPITIDDGISPLDGVDVWVTTDSAGTNVVARGYTDTLGTVTFLLDAGPYYLWKQLSGYTFINPEGITVS